MITITPVDYFNIFGLHVPVHGIFLPLAFLVYFWLVLPKLHQKNSKEMVWFVVLFLFLSLLGGRIWYGLFHEGWNSWVGFFTESGLASEGMIVGGVVSLILFLLINKSINKDFAKYVDIFALYGAIPIIIYRIGCFIHQCCYGIAASPDLPWAVHYAGTEIIRHPTQLYYIVHSIIIFGILWFFFRIEKIENNKFGRIFDGWTAICFLLFYGLGRFLIGFYRYYDLYIFKLSISQWISLMIVLITGIIIYMSLSLSFFLDLDSFVKINLITKDIKYELAVGITLMIYFHLCILIPDNFFGKYIKVKNKKGYMTLEMLKLSNHMNSNILRNLLYIFRKRIKFIS